jgi:hypothetical protein
VSHFQPEIESLLTNLDTTFSLLGLDQYTDFKLKLRSPNCAAIIILTFNQEELLTFVSPFMN